MWLLKYFRAEKRISELEEDFASVKRRVESLQLDFEQLYDKVKRGMQRWSKRQEFVEKAEEAQQAAQLTATPISAGPFGGQFTDRQKEIQQRILRRRAGG